MPLVELTKELSQIPGVSGWEDPVRAAIIEKIRDYCTYEVDALGNLIAFKQGAARAGRVLQLSAHMDEVGFLITMIEDSGLLRFATVGGIDSRVVVGKPVLVGKGEIPGIIATKPIHLQKEAERETPLTYDQLYIDIGALDKKEAEQLVTPGDRVHFRSEFRYLGQDAFLGRALDDRAGCALLVALIRSELPYDCVFTFTVQEETGCTGAITAAYRVQPEIAIAVETTTASDIAGVPADKTVCQMGKGPVLSFMDRGTIYDHELYHAALDLAQREGIACQSKLGVAGGNESRFLQSAREGARVLAVSLPCRYLHSPSCMLHRQDLVETERLLRALIGSLASA